MPPRFIVLEGLDGSGKSTQIRLLSRRMSIYGLPHITTREPSVGVIGALARKAIHNTSLKNEALALLFAADRYQHVKEVIAPALEQGKYVFCDRYYYSNLVYQGSRPKVQKRLLAYNQTVMANHRPDITFFLDVEPEECMRRIRARSHETTIYENLTRLREDRERFLDIFKKLNDNVVIINCINTDSKNVLNQIWQYLAIETTGNA